MTCLGEMPEVAAHFSFDEGSGMAVTESVSGTQGELVNVDPDLAWIEGKVGGAIRLDGANDRIFVPHNDAFDFGDEDFTVTWWMRWPEGALPSNARFFTKGDYDASQEGQTGKRWELFIANHENMTFVVDDAEVSSRLKVKIDPFITGEWVHAAAVRDTKNDQLKLYANGVLQESIDPEAPKSNGIDETGSITNPQRLTIGDAYVLDAPYMGDMDEVRIYRAALSNEQIAALVAQD